MSDWQDEPDREIIGGAISARRLYSTYCTLREKGFIRPLRCIPPRTVFELCKISKKQWVKCIESEEVNRRWNEWLVEWAPEFFEAMFQNAPVIGGKINADMMDDDKRTPSLIKLWLETFGSYLEGLGLKKPDVEEHVIRHLVPHDQTQNINWNEAMPEADKIALREPTLRRLLPDNGEDT